MLHSAQNMVHLPCQPSYRYLAAAAAATGEIRIVCHVYHSPVTSSGRRWRAILSLLVLA